MSYGHPTEGRSPGRGLLAALDDRRLALAAVGPNWFASVMGTSIVATAAARLPVRVPGLRPFAVRHPQRARAHLDNPVMAQFYGAPPMALLAFGAATLLAGGDLIGARAVPGPTIPSCRFRDCSGATSAVAWELAQPIG